VDSLLLPHNSRYYRLIINQAEVMFQLIEAHQSARLVWDKGVFLFNTALDMPIPLPTAEKNQTAKVSFGGTALCFDSGCVR